MADSAFKMEMGRRGIKTHLVEPTLRACYYPAFIMETGLPNTDEVWSAYCDFWEEHDCRRLAKLDMYGNIRKLFKEYGDD